jgi:hypothetical protein
MLTHYESGGKEKKGWDQLQELEGRLGILPKTFTSSDQDPMERAVFGISVFLKDWRFSGKAAKDIEPHIYRIQICHSLA